MELSPPLRSIADVRGQRRYHVSDPEPIRFRYEVSVSYLYPFIEIKLYFFTINTESGIGMIISNTSPIQACLLRAIVCLIYDFL